MKKIVCFFVALFMVACGNTPFDDDEDDPWVVECNRFVFVNKSGVQVAVVVEQREYDEDHFRFPDSLVLLPGREYSWELSNYANPTSKRSPVYFPSAPLGEFEWIRLYYDEEVLVTYKSYTPEGKSPGYLGDYTQTVAEDKKYKSVYTYTFTTEDYQQALEQNNTKE